MREKKLSQRKCVPCEGGVPPLGRAEVEKLAAAVPEWKVEEGKRLRRKLEFDDFVTLMDFVNDMATMAEEQGHHPDFSVSYDKLEVKLTTHAIKGLSENDFILAARIDELLDRRGEE